MFEVLEINVATGETYVRPYTDAELEQQKKDAKADAELTSKREQEAAQQAEAAAKREAVLAALAAAAGLEIDEVKAALG